MICQCKDKYFKEFFYYGIEDKQKIFEYIIYRALQDSHKKLGGLKELFSTPNEEHLRIFIETSRNKYKQFHRFINLPDNAENFTYKTENENEEITEKVSNKVNDLIQKGNIIEYKAGYFFTREKEGEFINEENEYRYNNKHIGWPCIIYKFLEELDQLENKNKELYDLKWLQVRIMRAINRTPPNKEELQKLMEICQANEKEIVKFKRMLEVQGHQDR